MLGSLAIQPKSVAVAWSGNVFARSFLLALCGLSMWEAGAGVAASMPPDIQPPKRPNTWRDARASVAAGNGNGNGGTVAVAAASAFEDGQQARRSGPYTYSGARPWHQRWNPSGSSNSWRRTQDKERPLKPQRRGPDDHRYWLNAPEPTSCREKFILVSYNILSADNATEHWHELYNHIPYYIMEWNRRKRKLVQELGLWSPDIICLQEVDRYVDLQEELEAKGYEGVFQARTGKATDGCAIFWRKNRFRLKHHEGIEFRDLDLRDNVAQLCLLEAVKKPEAEIKGTEGVGNVDTGDAIGSSGAGPKAQAQAECVLVGNIHVLFNPKRGDIKLGQVRVLTDRADSLSREFGGVPVVLGGDFNSTPSSPLYQFLSNSELDLSKQDRRRISGQVEASGSSEPSHFTWRNPNTKTSQVNPAESSNSALDVTMGETVNGNPQVISEQQIVSSVTSVENKGPGEAYANVTVSSVETTVKVKETQCGWSSEELKAATGSEESQIVRHKLRLRSAYSEIEAEAGSRDATREPLATSFHQKFVGTVDYIWHTDGLQALRVLDTLPMHVLQRSRGLPTTKWGSDHLALACELGFQKPVPRVDPILNDVDMEKPAPRVDPISNDVDMEG